MPGKRAPADRRIAELAGRQHGVVSMQQLLEMGVRHDAVLERHRAGRLHRLHRGIYAVGHLAPSNERRWMAAVLALGDGAVLSHRSAAALWRLLPPTGGPVDISLPGRAGRRHRQGLRIHRPASLGRGEVTRERNIPVTSPARTLADLRRIVPDGELRRAIRQADFLGLPTGPGAVPDGTRSELERSFLSLCRRYRLPMPAVNKRVGGLTVDFCWVEEKLVVETDGYRAHRGRAAFEDDRARDLRLRALGYQVQHLSYRQVLDEAGWVADALGAVLRASRLPP